MSLSAALSVFKGPGITRALLVLALVLPAEAWAAEEGGTETARTEEAKAKAAADAGFMRDVDWVGAAENARDQAVEQEAAAPRKRKKPWFLDDELLARAGVSEETAAAILETIAETEAEFNKAQLQSGTEAASAMRELFRVLQSDEFDEAEAEALLDEVLEQRAGLIRAQLAPKIKVRALLSASQIAAIRAERPRFFMERLKMPQTAPAESAEEAQADAEAAKQ